MVVCFSIGKSSKGAIANICKALDNITFHTFDTIQDIVKEASLRHLNFKRIIISNTIIKDTVGDLNELNDFIKNYSSSTEVVVIINSKLDNAREVMEYFCKVFNSPMYTIAEMGTATTRTLAELLTHEIVYIQETYFPSKKEIYNNLGKNLDSYSSGEIDESISSNSGEMYGDNSKEIISDNTSSSIVNTGEMLNISKVFSNENFIKSDFNNVSPVRVGVGDDLEDNFSDMGEDLSLGSFGSSHSDTGFLDDDDEEDLKEFIKSREEVKVDKEESFIVSQPTIQPDSNSNQVVNNVVLQSPSIQAKSKIDIILSLRNSSVHEDLMKEADKIATIDNAKVLIINADYKEGALLSYIENKGYNCSLNAFNPIRVGNIDVISNEYGVCMNEKDIDSVLNSSLIHQYDMVYIYCPLDCVSVLSEYCLFNNNIILNPGRNLVDYISTTKLLTSRCNLSLSKEKLIMDTCLLDLNNYNQYDIDRLTNMCLFANGSWLNRIGI